MGIDDFGSSDGSTSNEDSDDESSKDSSFPGLSAFTSESSSGGGGHSTKVSQRWVTKLDWGKPYVVVARDRQGNIYVHKDHLAVLREADDWERLDEHPNKDFEVLFRMSSREGWLRFCHLAQEQLGVNLEEVLEDDPQKIVKIEDEVYWPPKAKPSPERLCRICGKSSTEDSAAIVTLDLQTHRKVPVCADHTVEELALEGLLE